jgi:3D (Asp-Asp-Asp) domain-containing protein
MGFEKIERWKMKDVYLWVISVCALGVLVIVYDIRAYMKSDKNDSKVVEYKEEIPKYREVLMNVSAYCPCEKCCGEWSDGITSTGKDAYTKGVAVDPKVIPLGTKIEIPDYGVVYADDVGGSIKGNKLDVRFKTHQEALNWGRKHIKVKIWEDTKN